MVYKDREIKRGPNCCYVYLFMGGGGFFIFESLFATLFSMWGHFCYVSLLMVFFLHNRPFLSFFPCRGFLLRLSPYEGPFSRLKAFLLLFSLCGGLFATFFFMGGFFHYLKALLLRFSSFGGPFSPFKGFLPLFSLCGALFATFFSLLGHFFTI